MKIYVSVFGFQNFFKNIILLGGFFKKKKMGLPGFEPGSIGPKPTMLTKLHHNPKNYFFSSFFSSSSSKKFSNSVLNSLPFISWNFFANK